MRMRSSATNNTNKKASQKIARSFYIIRIISGRSRHPHYPYLLTIFKNYDSVPLSPWRKI